MRRYRTFYRHLPEKKSVVLLDNVTNVEKLQTVKSKRSLVFCGHRTTHGVPPDHLTAEEDEEEEEGEEKEEEEKKKKKKLKKNLNIRV